MSVSPPKFRVAIIGGGVGGLTLALNLARDPEIEVDVYEAAREFTELGAGIGLWPRAWHVLRRLGVFDEIAAKKPGFTGDGQMRPVFKFRLGDRPEGIEFWNMETPGGLLQIHRAAFQAPLLARLPSAPAANCRRHTSKRLAGFAQPAPSSGAPITLTFADGTIAACDVLFGADGVRSAVRSDMGMGGEVWSGVVAYRALVDAEQLRARYPGHSALREGTETIGKDGFVLTYLINNGAAVNFVAFISDPSRAGTPLDGPPVREANADEIRAHFRSWDSHVQALIDCVDTTKRWAVEIVPPLPTFVSGRVALLGDAAHAMPPFQGAGAGQAIEDAYLLSTLLTHPSCTLPTLPRALAIFDAVRRPLAQEAWRRSQRAGALYMLQAPDIPHLSQQSPSMEVLGTLARAVRDEWEWCWTTTCEGDVRRAVAMFEAETR